LLSTLVYNIIANCNKTYHCDWDRSPGWEDEHNPGLPLLPQLGDEATKILTRIIYEYNRNKPYFGKILASAKWLTYR
jgi:hypothetical protein